MTGEELEALVRAEWRDLLRNFGLSTAPDGENTVFVAGTDLLLEVLASRDGVSISYVDQTKPELPLYSVDSFLLRKRRDRLQFLPSEPKSTSFVDYTAMQLAAFARHLSRAGQDILRGERGWLSEHGPSHTAAEPRVQSFLDAPHTFHPAG